MGSELVLLAVLMGAVTYPARALPLLAPGVERLPPPALEYLRLVGPGVLAALAAVNVLVVTGPDGLPTPRVGIELVAVGAGIVVARWRHSVFLGIVVAVAIVALARALPPA